MEIGEQISESKELKSESINREMGTLQEADKSQMWIELLREEYGIADPDTLPLEK